MSQITSFTVVQCITPISLWQDMPRRIHPPTKPHFLPAFWRTRAVHLAKTEIGNLFFQQENSLYERVNVCQMRQVCVCVVLLHAFGMHLFARADDRQRIRKKTDALWLMPALSDWQPWTYHCFSSLASLQINLICLILEVEALLSAGSKSCSLNQYWRIEWFSRCCAMQFLLCSPNRGLIQRELACPASNIDDKHTLGWHQSLHKFKIISL